MDSNDILFSYRGVPYQFRLVDSQESDNSITVNGKNYEILADQRQIPLIREILSKLPADSKGDLSGRIKSFLATSTHPLVGPTVLGTTVSWKDKEIRSLPHKIALLAEGYWQAYKGKDTSNLRTILGKEHVAAFDRAMQSSDSEELADLLKKCNLTFHNIWDIYFSQRLPYPLSTPRVKPYTLTPADLSQIEQYLTDIHFTGVVRISDAQTAYTLTAKGAESIRGAPFPIHSVGKMFTGVIILQTMPKEAYSKPLALDPSVIKKLHPLEQQHLLEKKPTLHQAMTHNAGFGDYLGNYESALQTALAAKAPLPVIANTEDFLHYSNGQFFPLNASHYSNTGILLTALGVQHYTGIPFERTLEAFLSDQNIALSPTRPANARFNAQDPSAGNVVGGPSGGYWSTAENLHNLGTYLNRKCLEDPEFFARLTDFGQEFYVSEDREIRHNGCSSAGSALLSSFLDPGITLTILTDQGNFMADKVYHIIRENLLDEP